MQAIQGLGSRSGAGSGPGAGPSPSPGLEFDSTNYANRVRQFAAVTNREIGEVIRDEARLLIQACIARTPPFSGKQLQRMGPSKAEGTARQIGEKAIRRDVRRLFRPVTGLDLYRDNAGFKKAADEHDSYTIRAFLKNAKNFDGVAVSPDPAFHKSQRGSRGRVYKKPKWKAILNASSVENYVKAKARMVGYARAGWKRAAVLFGTTLAGWMSRHNAPGYAKDSTRNTAQPEAQGGNGVPYIQWAEGEFSVVRGALRERERILRVKIHKAVDESFHWKPRSKGSPI